MRIAGDRLRHRQALGVMLEPLDTEQLGTNRFVGIGKRIHCRRPSAEKCRDNHELYHAGASLATGEGRDVARR
jgi:hypothetical protein